MKATRITLFVVGLVFVACTDGPTTVGSDRGDLALSVVGSETVQLLDLGPLTGLQSAATAINETGMIVGYTDLGSYGSPEVHAFHWSGGDVVDLTTLGGYPTRAQDINNDGAAVGESRTGTGEMHAFVWRGSMEDLGTLGGTYSSAYAVNDAESMQVVGASTTSTGELHAFIWDSDAQKMYDLHREMESAKCSRAFDVNDQNHVVGMAGTSAFLWREGIGVTLLPTPAGGYSAALAINEADQIVGIARQADDVLRAVMWEDGVMTDLGTLKPGVRSIANAVNDAGQVVGFSGTVPTWSCEPMPVVPPDPIAMPFVRDDKALVPLSVYKEGHDGSALDINNNGLAVGWSGSFDSPSAVRWTINFISTPEEATLGLIESVGELESAGSLSNGAAPSLLGKLDAVTRQLNKGHTTPALKILEAFIKEVEMLLERGDLAEAEAAQLLSAAHQAIELLNG